MTKNGILRIAVARVRAEASAARAFFHTWKTFEMARGNAELLAAMNDPRYTDFFLASLAGNFRLFFLSLGNILDKHKNSTGIKSLKKVLKKSNYKNLTQEIDELVENYQNTIDKVRDIRNNSIAHNNFETADEIFNRVSVTPDQIEGDYISD